MTDTMKVKHAIAVLQELVKRQRDTQFVNEFPVQNVLDLVELLKKPHKKSETKLVICSNAMYMSKPNLAKWSIDMDRIMRIDKRTPEQLCEVIDWCQQDKFWQDNILSASKLRDKLDRLELQMSKDWQWQKRKLHRQSQRTGPTAKEKYLEKMDEANTGDNG
jgi:hypothetical protein